MPKSDKLDAFRDNLINFRDRITSDDGWISKLNSNASLKLKQFKEWIEEAKEAKRLQEEGVA